MNIVLIGHGRMGQLLESMIAAQPDMTLAAVIDESNTALLQALPKADVALDFSSPAVQPLVEGYITRTGTALLCGTTGQSPEQQQALQNLGKSAPVLVSANYSLGVAVMARVLREMAAALPGYDIEVTETHHNRKADAPSGTAKLLVKALDPEGKLTPVYGREGVCGPRDAKEIGIHSLRGGTVAGEHTVSFFGEDEVLELTHKAASRSIFASGALHAARALCGRTNGYYTLEEVLFPAK